MKKTALIVVSALISVTLIAQGRSGNNHGHQKKDQHEKGHHDDKHESSKPGLKVDIKIGPESSDKHDKYHDKHHDKHKDHPGNGHAYGHHKDGMTGREFGQHRAEEARSKHHPHNREEAGIRIVILKKENISLFGILRDKFRNAREKLEGLLKGGTISKRDYDSKNSTLNNLEARHSRIEVKISL